MKLPNCEKAVVDIAKLREYSLNPNHPKGKHKARVFKSALGITIPQTEWLRLQALEAAIKGETNDESPPHLVPSTS